MSVASPVTNNIRAQYFDGTVWQDFGPSRDLVTALRTRRFTAGLGASVTARKFRIVGQKKDDLGGAVSVKSIGFLKEVADLSSVRQIPFSFNADQFYSLWVTDRNVDIFANGNWLAAVSIPHTQDEISQITYDQALDTLLLFHKNHAPWRVFRQGAHTEWDSRPQPFVNLPIFDYDGTAIGGVDAQQQIRFRDYLDGDAFNISIAGETTTTINYTSAGVAASVQSALGALKNIDASGLSVTGSGALVTINFTGANGNREWPELVASTISSTEGGVVTSTLVRGAPGGEAVISDTRGWPRCGAFFEQGLVMAGLKSRPATFLRSVVGDYFNFNATLESADVGLDLTLDGSDVVEIRHVMAGRHLMMFTAGSEHYIPTSPITRDTISIRQSSSIGSRSGIRPVLVDGPALFIERRSGTLRAFVFSEGEQSYVSEPISMHASHLLPGPIDMARRPARTAKEADLILIPNDNGAPLAALTLLRAHDITAFTRFTTQGEILAIGVENQENFQFAVKRGEEIYLEVLWDDCYLDSSRVFTEATPASSFALDHLDGESVTIMRNGYYFARTEVVDGVVSLDAALDGIFEIGLEFAVEFKTLPVRRQSEKGGFSKKRYRIIRADFNFEFCGAFDVSANGSKFYQYEPQTAEDNLDVPLPIFTESKTTRGFPGSSVRPQLHFRQAVPAPFHLRSLDMETSE